MAKVVLTPEADRQMQQLPRVIRYRLHDVVDRLERWPDTSGAKPLRHGLKGHYRIRTGAFRVLFRVVATRSGSSASSTARTFTRTES